MPHVTDHGVTQCTMLKTWGRRDGINVSTCLPQIIIQHIILIKAVMLAMVGRGLAQLTAGIIISKT